MNKFLKHVEDTNSGIYEKTQAVEDVFKTVEISEVFKQVHVLR